MSKTCFFINARLNYGKSNNHCRFCCCFSLLSVLLVCLQVCFWSGSFMFAYFYLNLFMFAFLLVCLFLQSVLCLIGFSLEMWLFRYSCFLFCYFVSAQMLTIFRPAVYFQQQNLASKPNSILPLIILQ